MKGQKDTLLELGKLISKQDAQETADNEIGETRVLRTCSKLKALFDKQPAEVSCKLHEPFRATGCITVSGSCLIMLTDTKKFAALCAEAENIDVYPKTDGTVQMDLSFIGLAFKEGGK